MLRRLNNDVLMPGSAECDRLSKKSNEAWVMATFSLGSWLQVPDAHQTGLSGKPDWEEFKMQGLPSFLSFFQSRIKDSWLAIILFSTSPSTTWRIVFHVCDEMAHHMGIWRGSLWTQISSTAIEWPWAPTVLSIERPRWAVFSLLRELSDFPNLRYSF